MILVVDDEPQIARTLRINLTARGYEVLTAHDGTTALRTASDRKPDLVVHRRVHGPVLDPPFLAEHRPRRPRSFMCGFAEHHWVDRHPRADERCVTPTAPPHRDQHQRRARPPGPRAPRMAVPCEHRPFDVPPVHRHVSFRFRRHRSMSAGSSRMRWV
jgi:hypothetical protein